jgi:AcrR family transcriptional regulator
LNKLLSEPLTIVTLALVAGGEDGRRERRERNRDAVIEAVLEIIAGGDLEPTVDEVAARAGISARSVFRYFDDLDDMCRAGLARQRQRVDGILLAEPDLDPRLTLQERIEAVIGQRVELFEAMGKVGEFARLRAPYQPIIAEQLTFVRALLRRRLATACGPELTGLGPDVAECVVAAADVLSSFEAYRLLRDDHGRSRLAAEQVLVTGVTALLVAAPVSAR